MQPFRSLTAVAASLPMDNVDTDAIIPARFLKTLRRAGLGAQLFADLRGEGKDFVLDRPPFDKAGILVAGANFGCGSSREHAPWALADFGIRCIIAPSFADIFHANCFANGILPVAMEDAAMLAELRAAAERGEEVSVSLEDCSIRFANRTADFTLDETRRQALLEGRDAIGGTLCLEGKIAAYEAERATKMPWLAGNARRA